MPSTISAGTTAGTAIAIAGDTTGNLAFQTNGTTTAMTVDTSQNVGIGTTSPAARLHVRRGTGGTDFSDCMSQFVLGDNSSFTDGILAVKNAGNRGSRGNGDGSVLIKASFNNADAFIIDKNGNMQMDSGYGSAATAYGCRAWCSLNGTGTIAIRGSGNISSVADIGTGNYQYNLANAMPDANYGTSYSDYVWGVGYTDNFQSTSFRSQTVNSSFAVTDPAWVQVAVFR